VDVIDVTARLYILIVVLAMLTTAGGGQLPHGPGGDGELRTAIARSIRAAGYEVTDKRPGHDGEVVSLEERDAAAYGPSTRAIFRLRSLRPWGRSPSTYFRYWLLRETYESEGRAEKRAAEYMTDYTERLASAAESSHMISKTIIRVGVRRRGATVYLLVTDGAYTLSDDKGRDKMLDAIVKAKGT
jgi:hypothetical protein